MLILRYESFKVFVNKMEGHMFHGQIDRCDSRGFISGWARCDESDMPCVVSLYLGEEAIMVAVADKYRVDLLSSNIGHGHYGFCGMLRRNLVHGFYDVDFRCRPLHSDTEHFCSSRIGIPLLEKDTDEPLKLEDLISNEARWSDREIFDNVQALGLSQICDRMGVSRFVDVTYTYILRRMADPEGLKRYSQAIRDKEISAEQFFKILMQADERKEFTNNLASPFESDYPYRNFSFINSAYNEKNFAI